MKDKLKFWKIVFLLFLFIIGILIGLNMNRARMDIAQDDPNNNLIIKDMKECCSFTDLGDEIKVCKAISDHGCEECMKFCEGRSK